MRILALSEDAFEELRWAARSWLERACPAPSSSELIQKLDLAPIDPASGKLQVVPRDDGILVLVSHPSGVTPHEVEDHRVRNETPLFASMPLL